MITQLFLLITLAISPLVAHSSSSSQQFMQEFILPTLERYYQGEQAAMLERGSHDPSVWNGVNFAREMEVIAAHASTLSSNEFNEDILMPLQQLYVERKELRVGITQLMGDMDALVAAEIQQHRAWGPYSSTIGTALTITWAYVIAHSYGTATAQTQAGGRAINSMRNSIRSFVDTIIPNRTQEAKAENQSCRGHMINMASIIQHSKQRRSRFTAWIEQFLGRYPQFSSGLVIASGAGLTLGVVNTVKHLLWPDVKLSPKEVLTAANRYVLLRNSFIVCTKLIEAEQWQRASSKKNTEAALRVLNQELQGIGGEIEALEALSPEFKQGVTVIPSELDLQDFWFPRDPINESCKLRVDAPTESPPSPVRTTGSAQRMASVLLRQVLSEEETHAITLSTLPVQYQLQRAQQIIAPILESFPEKPTKKNPENSAIDKDKDQDQGGPLGV